MFCFGKRIQLKHLLLLHLMKQVSSTVAKQEEKQAGDEEEQVDTLDLDDLDFTVQKPILSAEASAGRTSAQIL